MSLYRAWESAAGRALGGSARRAPPYAWHGCQHTDLFYLQDLLITCESRFQKLTGSVIEEVLSLRKSLDSVPSTKEQIKTQNPKYRSREGCRVLKNNHTYGPKITSDFFPRWSLAAPTDFRLTFVSESRLTECLAPFCFRLCGAHSFSFFFSWNNRFC